MTWIILAAIAATAAGVAGLVFWLERGESRQWAASPERKAARDAWVAKQGPRVGEWTYYVGPSMHQPDGTILLMGASVRVARRWTGLDGIAMAKVEPVVGQPWRVPVAALQDLWDREEAA